MSAAGWLHAALLQGDLSLGCRFRQPQPSSCPFSTQAAPQAHALLRERCVSRHATGSGTTAQPAAAQLQQPVTQLQQQQQYQQLSGSYGHPLQPRQQQQQQQQDWQEQLQVTSSRSSQFGQLGTQEQQQDTTALDKPEAITAAISKARNVAQLQALLDQHGPHLNHIHISAAFVTLQRLWTSSSSSSETPGRSRQHSRSNGASASSIGSHPSSSPSPRAVLLQLQALAQGLTRVDGRYCANVLYSSALIEAAGEPAGYCGPLVDQVCGAAYELVNLMPPQELATLAWSLALLEVLPAPQLLARLVANVLRKLPGFKAQDIVMTLAGLPKLSASGSVAPYSTVHKLAAAAARQLQQASPLECALLLAVLASLHYKPSSAWLAAWWTGSEGKLAGMGPAELGMAGWALGRISPADAQPPAAWLEAWQQALAQACIHGSSSSSNGQHAVETAGASSSSSSPALVELAMGVYGWSKVAPSQPPSAEFRQLLYSTTQQAMAGGSTSRSFTQRQQQQQRLGQQKQQSGSSQQLLQQEQRSTLQSLVLQQSQQQLSHHQDCGSGVSGQLLVELLAAAARWQELPPRAWLLDALGHLQQQLAAGSCSSRDIASLLWALACLGVKPNVEWLHTCTAALQQQLQRHQQQQHQEQPAGNSWQQQVPSQAGASALQPGEQQLQARQLAISLWALSQLGHSVSNQEFWVIFWAASQPLLSVKFTLADVAMTLEGAVQQRQRPPAAWTQAALAAGVAKAAGAAADLPPAPAAGAAAARSPVGSAAERKRAKKQQGQQRRRVMLQHVAAVAGGVAGGVPRSAAGSVGPDLVRLATAAARLGGVPGHRWCCQVLAALRPAAHQLDQQALCRLVWCLGKLGYRPAGGALTGWLAARLAAPNIISSSSNSAGVPLSSYSPAQLGLLLSGLRGCRVVLGGRWLQQLLAHSTTHAQQMPLEVLVQLVSYVASARMRPPSSWCNAVVQALEAALPGQQQQQQWWSLTGLLAALVKLQLLPSQQVLQQLQQCAAAAQPQLSQEQVAAQDGLLQKLKATAAAAEQQPSVEASEQQQEQQQQNSGPLQNRAGNSQPQQVPQQQQWQAQRGSNAPASNGSNSSGSSSSRACGTQDGVPGSPAVAGGPWAGSLWVISSSNSGSSSSSSSSNVSACAASRKGHSGHPGTES